jgi:hypothetical protein
MGKESNLRPFVESYIRTALLMTRPMRSTSRTCSKSRASNRPHAEKGDKVFATIPGLCRLVLVDAASCGNTLRLKISSK